MFIIQIIPYFAIDSSRVKANCFCDIHAASFALKKYLKERWSPFFPTFKGGPATSFEVNLLPLCVLEVLEANTISMLMLHRKKQ